LLAEKTGRSDTGADIAQGEDAVAYDDEQQKFILVQVAQRLFHEKGFSKTSLSHIARGAGLSHKMAQNYFSSTREICHQVIDVYLKTQNDQFEKISHNSNARQRLSLYLDQFAEDSDSLVARGCPLTNLYFDVKREDDALAEHAAKLLQNRLDWIKEQFVMVMRVEGVTDLPERLASAIQGIVIMAQVTGNDRLIGHQVNQLKSWIRSM